MDSELLKIIGGGGAGAVAIAILYGLSLLVTAWRGGSASKEYVEQAEKKMARLDRLEKLLPVIRYQRDQARLRAESLAEKQGMQLPPWGEEPEEDDK